MATQTPARLMTLREASSDFGIPYTTLKGWTARGLLAERASQKSPGGRRILVDRDEVVFLIENPPRNGRPPKFPQT